MNLSTDVGGNRLPIESNPEAINPDEQFDPEGIGYDYASAKQYGITPDETGHWPSRIPETGMLLKGRSHETWQKTEAGEMEAGYTIRKSPDGRYYSFKDEPDSDMGEQYILSRQVANEYNAPAFQSLLRLGIDPEQWNTQKKEGFQKSEELSISDIENKTAWKTQEPGLEDPWIDPAMAATGGFGAVGKLSLSAGIKFMPSLAKAITAGVVGGLADIPLGIATENVQDVAPWAAMPFNLAVGIVSGATLENAVEKSVLRIAGVTGDAAKALSKTVYKELVSGEPESEIGKKVLAEFRSAMEHFADRMKDQSGQVEVWHGSPHKFDKFSMDKIGTGEGAQTFGYGLYFTEEKDIAKYYSENLTEWQKTLILDDNKYQAKSNEVSKYIKKHIKKGSSKYRIIEDLESLKLSWEELRDDAVLTEDIEKYKSWVDGLNSDIQAIKAANKIEVTTPNIYKATLHKGKNPTEYTWLDWDKPIKDQSEHLGKALSGNDAYINLLKATGTSDDVFGKVEFYPATGRDLYKKISKNLGSDKEASAFLLRAGIDGIRYPAGSLSGTKTSAKNYVVFDEDAITIEKASWWETAKEIIQSERGSIMLSGAKKESGVPESSQKIGDASQATVTGGADIARKYAGNINLNRIIQQPEDIRRIIAGTADQFNTELQSARRGKVSWAQSEKEASKYSLDDLLGRKIGQAYNAAEIENARTLLVSSSENLKTLRDKILTQNATDADKADFLNAFNTHYAIEMQVAGAAAEAGRALQIHAKVSQSNVVKTRQIQELLQQGVGKFNADKIAEMMTGMDSLHQINKFVDKAQRATTFDMLMEAWINGLLSGPTTHAVNTLSNTLVALWQVPERAIASQIGRITPGPQSISEGEVAAQAFGLIQGMKDGLKAAGKTLMTGEPSDPMGKIEARKFRAITAENVKQLPLIKKLSPNALEAGGFAARAVELLGETIRVPGRLLMAEDELFKGTGYRMELNALAYRKATQEGLTGNAFTNRINEIISDPEQHAPSIHLAAIDSSRYQTFTRELGGAGQAYQKVLKHLPALRIITPFVRTPTNIMKFGFERTPLAPLFSDFRANVAAGGARRDLALARMGLGSSVMGVTAVLASAGYITGSGPSDPGMKNIKYNTGWQPYSVKIDGKYYSYSRLEPLGMLLGLAADYSEIAGQISEGESEKLASAITMAISKNITSKTFLRGLTDAINAIEDPDRYGNRYIQRFAGTIVPTGIAQVERTMSPEMSAVYSILDQIKSRIPGYSDDLPPRRNIWGEPIVMSGGLGPDIISPIYTSNEITSPIDNELLRLKLPLRMPLKTQPIMGGRVDLDPNEYDRFIVLMNSTRLNSTGKTLKASLDNLVTKSNEYKTANDDLKEMMIRGQLTEARNLAQYALFNENPTIRQIVEYQNRAAVQ